MQLFKTMTLKTQLTLGFSIMVSIIALVVFINIVYVHHALKLSHRITDLRTPTANHSMVMLNGINHTLATLRGWMLLGQETFKEERNQVWLQQLEMPLREMKKLSDNWIHPENIEWLQEIEDLLPQVKQLQQEIEDIAQTPDNIPALKIFFEQAIPQSEKMSNHITQMIDIEKGQKANLARKTLLGIMADVRGTLGLSLASIRAFLLSGKPQFQYHFEALWAQNETHFHELQAQIPLLTPQQLTTFELFSQIRHTFFPLISQLLEMRTQPDWNQSHYWLATKAVPLSTQLINILQDMAIHQQQLLQHDGKEIETLIHRLIIIEWCLLGMGILLAGFLGWLMSHKILKQVGGEPAKIADITEQVATGNLDIPLESNPTATTGIYASVLHLVKSLKDDVIKQINRLAQGDYSVQIVPRSDKDVLDYALVELTVRLREITTISEAIATGDYSLQIACKGKNDLLGAAINNMTRKLQAMSTENTKWDWLKTGQAELNEKMRGEQEPIILMQNVLNYLADYINAQVAVFYLAKQDRFQLVNSYAYKKRHNNDNEFKLGEGLIGQAALEKKSILFSHVPKEHLNLSIDSGLCEKTSPNDIFVLPLIYENQVLGILELATSSDFTATAIELLDRVADNIAISLHTAQSRLRMQSLLTQSQQLTLTLQTQQQEIIESEERIRTIVDTILDAVITIDEQGTIDSFNQAAETMFGYSASEVIGQNVKILMPDPYQSEHDQYLQNYLRTGRANIIGNPREMVAQRKEGSIFPIDLAVSEMNIDNTRLFTGIVRDITERKKAEEALQVQQEELQSANEELQAQQEELAASNEELHAQQDELKITNTELEQRTQDLEKSRQTLEEKAQALELSSQYKSEFLANMSHELRTPLNSLLILAQLLSENKDANLTDKQVEYAHTIHSAGSDLLVLINDILDLAKVEAGKMEINAENISIADLMETIDKKFRHVAENKGLVFSILVADEVPPFLYSDVQRIKQIINNLLSNAFKFTQQGEIKLTIQREVENKFPTKTIAIHITDTGIGIPQDKQDLIFEAFQQADGTTNRSFGGTGLGLSISRQFAQLLGGDIQLDSEEGQGSTFTLYLPDNADNILGEQETVIPSQLEDFKKITTAKNEVSEMKPLEFPNISVPTSSPTANAITAMFSETTVNPPMPSSETILSTEDNFISDDRDDLNSQDRTILIIEDDNQFSRTLMDLAREKDFKCIVAADGRTGLQLAEDYKPDAIMLDISLPQIDGWTVMEKLKNNSETRHIPVHFMSASDQERDAKQMGAIGYLLKPVNLEQIGNAFKNIEQFIANTLKKLLIVVDNEQRRQEILDVVEDDNVQSTLAMNKAEACQHLQTTQFDCMILDVDLQQGSCIELLEQMIDKNGLCQTPLIVYAERDLTVSEEAVLQRCTNDITVKTVKTAERLLDEATLFLHQIEAKLSTTQRKMLRRVHDKEAIFANKKVLIVDDDVRNSFTLATVLEDRNMEVVAGNNGKEGIALLQEHEDIAIVLMDIMMPEMDGYQAMQEIRKQPRYRKLPIIALTAKAMKNDKAKCIEAGASDYISKPVDTERLISLMRVWLYQ